MKSTVSRIPLAFGYIHQTSATPAALQSFDRFESDAMQKYRVVAQIGGPRSLLRIERRMNSIAFPRIPLVFGSIHQTAVGPNPRSFTNFR